MPPRFQHAAHLRKTLVQIFKVTYPERYGNGIELVIGKRKGSAIFADERYCIRQTLLLRLLAPHVHHAFRNVCGYQLPGAQLATGKDGEVARSGSRVHDALRAEGAEPCDGFAAPAAVDA